MTNLKPPSLYARQSLDKITSVPDSIISVYVIEQHIWADGGTPEAKQQRRAERRTVDEFLIQPVRPFLNDIFRQMSAPYQPERKDSPIGQGYWIQAEFGSGKSHLLSFVGALALGEQAAWELVREKEQQAGAGRRESLYSFYENGLARKSQESKGILVAVKTLVGEGSGGVGQARNLVEYVLDAVGEQFFWETGRTLSLYPAEVLVERFLNTGDYERYYDDLRKFLKDPIYFDEEEQQEIGDFVAALQSGDPGVKRDGGETLWHFYDTYLRIRPHIPMEPEPLLENMLQRLLDEGYAGLLLILDEISIFMKGRTDAQRIDDEKTLVVLSNRLAKVKNLPVWLVCAAQEAIETKMAGAKNILARERLDLVPLLNNQSDYYDIALKRVRTITNPAAVDQYYEDYKRSFSWPQAVGQDEFARFFPFYPPSIDVVRAISYRLTTVRSALYFMLQTLKTQRKRQSTELITLWALFDDVIDYTEDPSGTTKGIASVKAKWPDVWRAYETARQQLDMVTKGQLKVYRNRADKILRTLFLYHVADRAPNGLSAEELMNSVMEWRDHDRGQEADLQDNLDHYGILADAIDLELAQVQKLGPNYQFNPTGGTVAPTDLFQKARGDVERDERGRRQAWEALLALDGWEVSTRLMRLDLGQGTRSIFREIAPGSQKDSQVLWHGREIYGRVFMRDLLQIAKRDEPLPSVNSAETNNDFAVFVSSTPAGSAVDKLIAAKQDPRILFWTPDGLNISEQALLLDFAAYRKLVADYSGRDTEEARIVLEWVQNRLRDQMGTIYRIVPDSYGRGRIVAQDHSGLEFRVSGELAAMLTPLVAQVLDTVYECKDLAFDAPAPFNDTNAVNVINGIVRVGEIERGAKPNKDISAAQNYGFDLKIMRRPNDRKLDLRECRYTQDLLTWIEDKLNTTGGSIPAVTVYKNFMGVGGPNGRNYGLSRRMVQLYLLCLVRDGKIRISLSGKGMPAEYVDYSNIAGIDFRTHILEGMDQIQRLRAPEGWELLAPYAAVLLDDETIAKAGSDAEIQEAVLRLRGLCQEEHERIGALRSGLETLFAELGVSDRPVLMQLAAWQTFMEQKIDPAEPIPYLRSALDSAFGYAVFADDRVDTAEVQDLRARLEEVRAAARFFQYRDRLRAAGRYAAISMPDGAALASVRNTLARVREKLAVLDGYIGNDAKLVSDLLDPTKEAIATYKTRYLQVYDQVTTRAEETRGRIEAVASDPTYQALTALAAVPQLGSDPRPELLTFCQETLRTPEQLFPTKLPRIEIERQLDEWPQPPQCLLTLENAGAWQERVRAVDGEVKRRLQTALLEKARLLDSPTLRERLAQSQDTPFIRGLLAGQGPENVARYLLAELGPEAQADGRAAEYAEQLARSLRRLQVRRVRLADFAPSKLTLEQSDVDAVVAEFRMFLQNALQADGEAYPVVELER